MAAMIGSVFSFFSKKSKSMFCVGLSKWLAFNLKYCKKPPSATA